MLRLYLRRRGFQVCDVSESLQSDMTRYQNPSVRLFFYRAEFPQSFAAPTPAVPASTSAVPAHASAVPPPSPVVLAERDK